MGTHDAANQTGRPTRRGLLGGAAATGAAGVFALPLLAPGAARSAAPAKPCAPEPEGIPAGALAATPSGRRVWTTDTRATTITPHDVRTLGRGTPVDVGGAPVGLAIAPGGVEALVTTAAYDRPGLAIVDLHRRTVDRLDVGDDPGAVAYGPGGHAAWVVGRGPAGTLTKVRPAAGRMGVPIALGSGPLGLAVAADGETAIVALNGAASLAVVDLRRGRVRRRIPVAPFPAQLALAPDGRHALVTHNGFGARAVSLVDLELHRVVRRIRTGQDPAGVAFSRSGRTAVVTGAGDGTLTLLDARTGLRRRRARPGGQPRAVVVCGTRAVVADARTGVLHTVRLGSGA